MNPFKSLAGIAISALFLASCQKDEAFTKQNFALDLEAAANLSNPSAKFIPDAYIVVLKDETRDVQSVANSIGRDLGSTPDYVYEHALKGFSIRIPLQALERLKKNPRGP